MGRGGGGIELDESWGFVALSLGKVGSYEVGGGGLEFEEKWGSM